jgi:methyl-accepting chemotaxis protein
MRKLNLRQQLLLGGAMLAVIPMLVLGTFTVLKTMKTFVEISEDATAQSVEKLCEFARSMVAQEIRQVHGISGMASIARVSEKVEREGREASKEDIESLDKEFSSILKKLGDQYSGIYLTDKDGLFIAGARIEGDNAPYKKMNVSDRDYFQDAKRDGKGNVGTLIKAKTNNRPVMIACTPVYSEKGQFQGILATATKIDSLIQLISSTKIGKTGYAFMIDNTGLLVAHPDKDLIFEKNIVQDPGLKQIGEKMIGQVKGKESYTLEGIEKEGSFAPVGIRGWSIAAIQAKKEIIGTAREFRDTELLIGTVLLGLTLICTYLFGRGISKPISRAVGGIFEVSKQVAVATNQVSQTSQELSEGASNQAASIEETGSSLEQMSSMTRQNADNSGQADTLLSGTQEVLSRASQSMEKLKSSMGEISRASEETSKIIKTIDEIAFQTNLLALNAAVEAARAGETGAGFAIVADEVRNLAMRAAEAAKNTANLIEGTVAKVKDGARVVEETSAEFGQVVAGVSKTGELVGGITKASFEQAQGIELINRAVSEMDKVVQKNASNAEELASTSEEMNSQAANMKGFIEELVTIVGGGSSGD